MQSSTDLKELADTLNNSDLQILLRNIQKNSMTHAAKVKNEKKYSILESRFTRAQEAYDNGIMSCGAITNISAAILRYLGYEVKLIHGQIPQPLHMHG